MICGLVLRSDDADGLARPLTGTCVGLGALATHRKSATVAETTVAVNCLETLEVALNLTAKVTLDNNLLA